MKTLDYRPSIIPCQLALSGIAKTTIDHLNAWQKEKSAANEL